MALLLSSWSSDNDNDDDNDLFGVFLDGTLNNIAATAATAAAAAVDIIYTLVDSTSRKI